MTVPHSFRLVLICHCPYWLQFCSSRMVSESVACTLHGSQCGHSVCGSAHDAVSGALAACTESHSQRGTRPVPATRQPRDCRGIPAPSMSQHVSATRSLNRPTQYEQALGSWRAGGGEGEFMGGGRVYKKRYFTTGKRGRKKKGSHLGRGPVGG